MAQKRHLSLYVCAVVDGTDLPEARADRLGRICCGKGCIRFTSLDPVDEEELRSLIRDAVAATRSGADDYYAASHRSRDRRPAPARPSGPSALFPIRNTRHGIHRNSAVRSGGQF